MLATQQGLPAARLLVASDALKISSSLFQAVVRYSHLEFPSGGRWIREHIDKPIGAGGMHSRTLREMDDALARFLSDLFGML